VVVSTDQGNAIAAWNERAVAISRDDGRSFRTWRLRGERNLCEAAINHRGTVFLLCVTNDPGLGVFPPGRPPRWLAAPQAGGETIWLAAAGDVLLFYGRQRSAEGRNVEIYRVSTDEGRTWREPPGAPPGLGNFGNRMRVDPDGTIWAMSGSEAACGGGYQRRSRGSVAGADFTQLPWPLDSPGEFWPGAAGWAYAPSRCGRDGGPERVLCAVGPAEGMRPVAGPPVGKSGPLGVASNGRVTLAVVGRRLYRVRAGLFAPVDHGVPPTLAPGSVVDAQGRLVGLAGGRIVRWSAGLGWRLLVP
jgi:hypothetical protein